MQFKYTFPAVRGIQAGKEYYISMVPLKLLPRLFPTEEDIDLPEYRAQRKINEARIPEIKKYILNNLDNYVFSALSASIDGNFEFISFNNSNVGELHIDMDSVFLINDGQHRKAAIEEALKENQELGNETISIVFFKDMGLERSQQMFTDLNKHAVKTSNSLSTLYDSRDEIAKATKEIIDSIPFLKRYTDKERDILGKNSSKLFTLTTLYKANQRILHSSECTQEDTIFLKNYWNNVCKNIFEWNELMKKEITKKDLKENYIITLAITIQAFGKLGRIFYDDNAIDLVQTLKGLNNINWSRNEEDWIGIIIREDGRVITSEEAITMTSKKIEDLLNITKKKEKKHERNDRVAKQKN